MTFWTRICLLMQVLYWASANGFTIDGAVTHQRIEGIGVNVNYRSWDGTNLQPVLDAFIAQAGMSLFRVTHDLSDWEAANDDADPGSMNWDYYNSIYSTNEFTRLWDMFEYLNSRGCTNNAFFAFMGWGPEWMMAADGRTLAAGMEDEWAEMIASALIYARNTRGLKFSLVAPNNEPDINDEGIRMPTARQFTNALHRLAAKLDAAGMTNLSFVAPDRAHNNSGHEYLPEMMADPVIMARVRHFGLHNYNATGGHTANAFNYIQANTPDRTLWVTEFNQWCPGCDDGVLGNYGWDYTRGTAQLLLLQLQQGASAAMVWEGYDGVYAHHYDKWGFWGLMGVDDTNATVKTYTPRKHFYTVSQISKWVRPGARRIGVTGSTAPFSPLVAFKHDELGQVTIAGVNPGSAANHLIGSMVAVPSVREFELYYTTATTNLACGGSVPVEAGRFHTVIPANCVFTLTGFTARRLTNGVPRSGTNL